MKQLTFSIKLAPLVCGLALALIGGCSHDDPPVIIDAEEILRYMDEVGIAKELFRTTDLISEQPYTLPFESAVITDRVLNVTRTRDVFLVPIKIWDGTDSVYNDPDNLYQDYGSIGEVREGLVEVEDVITIETRRAYAADTVFDTGSTALYRYGFFLKAGSDNKPYVGWTLYGFRGVEDTELPVHVEGSGGADFFHTQIYDQIPLSSYQWIPHKYYERLTYMDTIKAGDLVHLTISNAVTYPTVTDFDSTGLFVRATTRYEDEGVFDTLSYRLPPALPRLYNLIFVQRFSPGNFPDRSIFAIPYRSQ